jgi:hypothetical protein
MSKFRVHTEDLNSYGFWIKTDGIDLSAFLSNPVGLWNHNRGWRGTTDEVLPICKWTELSVKDGVITALPVFDTQDEFAIKIAQKVEQGIISACSIGITVLEWSEDPAMLKAGQTRPTVIKSILTEISICDIPSNKSAVVLYDADGRELKLSEPDVLAQLPTLKTKYMGEIKLLAVQIGLSENASLQDVQVKCAALMSLKSENDMLVAQLKQIGDTQKAALEADVKGLLDAAITDLRLSAEHRADWEKLFENNFEAAKTALSAIPKPVSLSKFVEKGNGTAGQFNYNGKTYRDLHRENPGLLAQLKANDFATFNLLYKSEYGVDYKQ